MSVTIPDRTSAAVLAQTVGCEVEVFDPDGTLLGWFTPESPESFADPHVVRGDDPTPAG